MIRLTNVRALASALTMFRRHISGQEPSNGATHMSDVRNGGAAAGSTMVTPIPGQTYVPPNMGPR